MPRIIVELTLAADDLNPEFITQALGTAPSKTWRKGELVGKTQIQNKSSGWQIVVQDDEAYEIAPLLEELMQKVLPMENAIKQLVSKRDLDISVMCVIYAYEEFPAVILSNDTLRQIQGLGAYFALDVYL